MEVLIISMPRKVPLEAFDIHKLQLQTNTVPPQLVTYVTNITEETISYSYHLIAGQLRSEQRGKNMQTKRHVAALIETEQDKQALLLI